MEASMLLCDFAEAINGKLYIMGAGWSHIVLNQPTNFALAVQLSVPWDQTNMPIEVKTMLLDHDGQPVLDPNGQPIQLEGKVEVGRPPGIRPGSELGVPLAMRFGNLQLQPGRYTFQL